MVLKLRAEFGNLDEYVYHEMGSKRGHIAAPKPTKKGGILASDELPSPTSDRIFKRMFAGEETKKYACRLFSTFFEVDLEEFTEKMELYTNEFTSRLIDGRTVRVDFVGICEDVIFSLEMNNSNKLERNANYAHIMYAIEALESQKDFDIRYWPVVQLNINNFTLRNIHEPIVISVSRGGKTRRSKIIYIDVYLPLIASKYKSVGIEGLSDAERVILAMFTPSEREAKRLAGKDEEIMEFIERLRSLKKNEQVMEEYYDDEDTYQAGRTEGMERGLEQGRQEKQIEMATKMLKDGMNPETVQKYTDLSSNRIKNIMTLL